MRTVSIGVAAMVFVNLPVADIVRSRAFYTSVGFGFDELFCDSGTLCMRLTSDVRVMLHRTRRFAGYASAPAVDARFGRETVLAMAVTSRMRVDETVDAALRCGGTRLRADRDHDHLYVRGFCDPDGHAWEVIWMDTGGDAATCRGQ